MPLFGRAHGHTRYQSSPNAASMMATSSQAEGKEPPSTPKPTRTRARTLLSGPRTPLSRIFTSFGGRGADSWGKSLNRPHNLDDGRFIIRPSSASSAYSSSSDSSFESLRTNGTECTIPEVGENDGPKLGPAFCDNNSPLSHSSAGPAAQRKRKHYQEGQFEFSSPAVRDIEWTEEMDGHLWRTYMLYQNDPTVTPFYVVPNGVPPLGVCMRVARVARNTWKGPKLDPKPQAFSAGPSNRRARTPVTPIKGEGRPALVASNKADLMRRASSTKWSASESLTRKRLRILCRRGYGPTNNPYHNHRQDPTQFRPRNRLMESAMAAHPPSGLLTTIQDNANNDDDDDDDDDDNLSTNQVGNALLTSTRSMALSLATSTSISMRPDSALASLQGGNMTAQPTTMYGGSSSIEHLERLPAFRNENPSPQFHGFTDAQGNAPPVGEVLATVGIGYSAPSTNRGDQTPPPRLPARRARASTIASFTVTPAAALSRARTGEVPLAPGSGSQEGTLKIPTFTRTVSSPNLLEEFGGPLPPRPQPSAPQLGQGFLEPPSQEPPRTPAPNSRGRMRGYTVNSMIPPNLNGRRRSRPSSIVTQEPPTWAFEAPNGLSERPNLAQLLGAQPLSAGHPRLGSPFKEDNTSKGKWRSVDTRSLEEFGPPLPAKKSSFLVGVVVPTASGSATGSGSSSQEVRPEESPREADSERPIKRIRE